METPDSETLSGPAPLAAQCREKSPRSPIASVAPFITRVLDRWRSAWPELFASALGAALAWFLAQKLAGHPQPIFAAVSAVICLAPGLPSHDRQTVGLLLGVATGIAIGELSLLLPGDSTVLRIALASFLSMTIAVGYNHSLVVPIQAAVSAILVITFGPETAGVARMVDVLVGAFIGLVLSRALYAWQLRRDRRCDPPQE